MLKLVFFVPESHKESVKKALFNQGAGRYDGYDYCAWETLGTGQFKPLTGSQPFIGERDKVEVVAEYRVEMICAEQHIKVVLQALLASHPYETPAYDVQKIMLLDDF
ncbi:MAG: NGG1p interacting factor NIF3 [Gammaproteobacteria bacterium]|nr:MAG: NGG1p interacting factor NIF3 [Gammaproteobacteria bacterium]